MKLRELLSARHVSRGQWWERPWSLVDGCTKCSPGCLHCWSEAVAMRFGAWAAHVAGGVVDENGWTGKVVCREDRLALPLQVQKPTLWSVWNDLFHPAVPDNFILMAVGAAVVCRQHAFLILTKRAKRMRDFRGWAPGPLPNVALGVSVPDQATADRDIPILLETPAALRWINVGPMLEPLRLDQENGLHGGPGQLDWVAVECESGPRRRPCEIEWIEDLVCQCQDAGVPCWVKQVQVPRRPKAWLHEFLSNRKGKVHPAEWKGRCDIFGNRVSKDMSEWPEAMRVRQMPEVHVHHGVAEGTEDRKAQP